MVDKKVSIYGMKCRFCDFPLIPHCKSNKPVGLCFYDKMEHQICTSYLWCPQCGLMYQFIVKDIYKK